MKNYQNPPRSQTLDKTAHLDTVTKDKDRRIDDLFAQVTEARQAKLDEERRLNAELEEVRTARARLEAEARKQREGR